MTAAAAVTPVAALREVRGAAARRALAVTLFLGGLLTLGILCADRAHATDRTSTTPAAAGTAVEHAGTVERAGGQLPGAPGTEMLGTGSPGGGAVPEAAGEVAEPVIQAVAQSAKGTPVKDAPVKGAVPDIAGVLPAPSEPPRAPTAPVVPAVPGAALPPAPQALPPATPAVPGAPGGAQQDAAQQVSARHDAAHARTQPAQPAPPYATMAQDGYRYGHADAARAFQPGASQPRAAALDTARDAFRDAPFAPAPCGGGAVRQSAGDGGAPRPGDQHAVASQADPYGGRIRGAALPTTAAPTHDRPHAILEFPG
ncbi:hypothetical protein QWM81_22170 [Streptomyces ficellus]|uniref:Translation initiation factor IF-2 n=1 Tax=Streptomyces ficellus TaxID=1977088 RepID=A0ABT7ZB14_9ACTN|nr:hypothetical protein [Streptomyces ficellus]MDN3296702.1 hypothetical protein [Streptomyces ficellus]